jgi:hypothetical protein
VRRSRSSAHATSPPSGAVVANTLPGLSCGNHPDIPCLPPPPDPPPPSTPSCPAPQPRVASAEVVTTWNELSKCPYIRDTQVLVHPGEVNKIRELPQHPNVIVTHTDDPRLYVWNLERQPNHKKIPGLNKEVRGWVGGWVGGWGGKALFGGSMCVRRTPRVGAPVVCGCLQLWAVQGRVHMQHGGRPCWAVG